MRHPCARINFFPFGRQFLLLLLFLGVVVPFVSFRVCIFSHPVWIIITSLCNLINSRPINNAYLKEEEDKVIFTFKIVSEICKTKAQGLLLMSTPIRGVSQSPSAPVLLLWVVPPNMGICTVVGVRPTLSICLCATSSSSSACEWHLLWCLYAVIAIFAQGPPSRVYKTPWILKLSY